MAHHGIVRKPKTPRDKKKTNAPRGTDRSTSAAGLQTRSGGLAAYLLSRTQDQIRQAGIPAQYADWAKRALYTILHHHFGPNPESPLHKVVLPEKFRSLERAGFDLGRIRNITADNALNEFAPIVLWENSGNRWYLALKDSSGRTMSLLSVFGEDTHRALAEELLRLVEHRGRGSVDPMVRNLGSADVAKLVKIAAT